MGLAYISGIQCDILTNSVIIYGPDTSKTPVLQFIVIRGSVDRSLDDRTIVYKSTRTVGLDLPVVMNIGGNLIVNFLSAPFLTLDSLSLNVNNIIVSVDTIQATPVPVPQGSSYTITAEPLTKAKPDSKTAKFEVIDIDHTIKVTSKSQKQEEIGEGGIF
jgi:hypothetical protein